MILVQHSIYGVYINSQTFLLRLYGILWLRLSVYPKDSNIDKSALIIPYTLFVVNASFTGHNIKLLKKFTSFISETRTFQFFVCTISTTINTIFYELQNLIFDIVYGSSEFNGFCTKLRYQ